MVHLLQPGSNIALAKLADGADAGSVSVRIGCAVADNDLDISVLLLGDDRKVRSNDDFVFYNQPTALGGAIQLRSGGDCAGIDLDLPMVVRHTDVVAVVASLDGAAIADVAPVSLLLSQSGNSDPLAIFEMSSLTSERAIVACELYRRNDEWKIRAVGQGYDGGLADLAVDFGVEVDDAESSGDTNGPVSGPEPSPSTESTAEVPAGMPSTSGTETTARQVVVGRKRRPARLPADWTDRTSPYLTDIEESPFRRARLFPAIGVKSAAEQEMRSTSILLATMAVVKEYGRAVTAGWGAPAGRIETFTEVRFAHGGEDLRPDGLVRVTRGSRQWTALVEVKTGKNKLKPDQVEKYLKLAKSKGFDALITISSDLTPTVGECVVSVDRRLYKGVELVHSSWEELVAEAAMLHLHVGVGEPTRAHVLGDFLYYASQIASGMPNFDDMGSNWVRVREAVKDRTLRADGNAVDVCTGFDRLLRHLALQLSALIGERITSVIPANRPDAVSRAKQLADSGELFGTLRIPGGAGPLVLNADLRTERIGCSMVVAAPRSGRPSTKVNWLTRQLVDAPDAIRLTAHHSGSRRDSTAVILGALRAERASLVPTDGKDIREFTIALECSMGTKRSGSSGGFVAAATTLLNTFYCEVVQTVRTA